ncbi:MAG: PTS sugar transporter subunit IIC, partial [Bacilli bacterium]|nr:PTS sugar transporter subunit IIC [Bacilli bacterium]
MMEKTVKESKNTNSFKEGLRAFKEFMMKTTNGMAIGLFGTLIIGTVLNLLAKIPAMQEMGTWASLIQGLMGAGIGLGVALSLKLNGVMVVAIMAAGFVGNYQFQWLPDQAQAQWTVGLISDPLSCYISCVLAYIVVKLVMRKKTPVDLLLIPLVGLLTAILYSWLVAEWIHYITIGVSKLIEVSFDAVPLIMCIVVSALVGMALTAPISSVAICVAIQIGNVPLAAAAALIGCCTQMVGFAVHTAHDNKWGSVIAVGIGTSMLQFKNILKKPLIWLPTIIVSAVLGPLAMLFPLDGIVVGKGLSVGAGMGTCGLVGPLNFFDAANFNWVMIVEVIAFAIVIPGFLVFLLDLVFRKAG